MGVIGVYAFVCPNASAANKMQNAECRMQTRILLLPRLHSAFCILHSSVIRCSSADPIAHQLDLRVGQVRSALRHAVAGDAGAGDLAIEVRVGGIARRDELERRHLGARHVDDVGVPAVGGEDQSLLAAERIVAAEGTAGGGEDLILHAGEGGGWIDRLTGAAGGGGELFELAATDEKQKKYK